MSKRSEEARWRTDLVHVVGITKHSGRRGAELLAQQSADACQRNPLRGVGAFLQRTESRTASLFSQPHHQGRPRCGRPDSLLKTSRRTPEGWPRLWFVGRSHRIRHGLKREHRLLPRGIQLPLAEVAFHDPAIMDGLTTPRTTPLGRPHRSADEAKKDVSEKALGASRREVERVKGIEPSSVAWEATALPLSYTRIGRGW